MSEERIPAEAWPLAYFLAEEIIERGWTTFDVAARMGGATVDEVSRDLLTLDLIMCVHKDNLLLGDDLPVKLGRAFDVSPDYFVNLDRAWRSAPAGRRVEFEPPDAVFGPISRRAAFRVVS